MSVDTGPVAISGALGRWDNREHHLILPFAPDRGLLRR
jgi:hypothetical protein